MKIKEGKIIDNGLELETVEIILDGTTLLIISGYGGFAMCGALDVGIYNSEKLKDRKVMCFKSVGVKTILELYNSKIVEASLYSRSKGVKEGMNVKEAFRIISSQ